MPLIPQEKRFQQGLPRSAASPTGLPLGAEQPTGLDVVGAAFRQNNLAVSLYDRVVNSEPLPAANDQYDPLSDVSGYETYSRRFIESTTPEETQQIKNRIDRELGDQKLIRDSGGFGLAASFAAGALDPATIASLAIPVAGQGSAALRIGSMVATNLVLDSASEVAFQSLQETRTVEQSLINVGAGTVLTGLIGGAIVRRVPGKDFQALRDGLSAELNAPLNAAGSTVGAASARANATLEDESIAGVGESIAKTIGRISPLSRMLTSPSKASRQAAQDLAEVPFVLTKNESGTANTLAVETLVKRYDAMLGKVAVDLDDAYLAYQKRASQAGQPVIKAVDFRAQVAAAMRRNDESAIPEVAALAKRARSEIIDPITKRLQQAGLLADPVADDAARLTAQAVDKYVQAESKQLFADYSARALQQARKEIGAARKVEIAKEREAMKEALAGLRAKLDGVEDVYRQAREQLKGLTRKERRAATRKANTDLAAARREERRGRIAERKRLAEAKERITAKANKDLKAAKPKRSGFEKAAQKGDGTDPALTRMADLLRKRDSGRLAKVVTVPPTKVKGLETVGAQSYLPRLYDVRKIVNNLGEFSAALKPYLLRNGVDRTEVDTVIADVVRNITGSMRGFTDIAPNVVVKAGPLKERTLLVPDEILEPFLINDVEKVLTQYVRSTAPQIELATRFGDLDMKQAVQNIKDEYDILMKAATTEAQRKQLKERMDADFEDLIGMRDRLVGKLGIPANPDSVLVRGARLMRSYNYVRLLGSQLFSSLADAGRLVTMYGLPRTGKALGVLATNVKAFNLARGDAKRMAIGLDWTLNTRGATLGDIGDFAETPAEVFAQKAGNFFSRVTGMATWNSAMKFLASSIQQDQILRTLAKGEIGDRNLTKFAQLGLDAPMLNRIAQQYAKYGDDSEGLARAVSEKWDDAEAALAYESAILKSADTAVLTKGIGDTPLFMSGEVAKTIFQFKSFGMAAVNRLLIPAAQGIQRGDIAMMSGLSLMLALGTLRYVLKQVTSDRPVETDPPRLISEAIDGAGLTSYLVDGYDVFAGMTGMPRASRYTDRSWIETAAGPSAGTITDFGRTIEDMRRDGVSERDIHKIRKLLPGQNIFYLRRLINAMEGETAEALGVPAE